VRGNHWLANLALLFTSSQQHSILKLYNMGRGGVLLLLIR